MNSRVFIRKGDYTNSLAFIRETFKTFKDIEFSEGEKVLIYFDGEFDGNRNLSTFPNPVFIEELVRFLLDKGVNVRVGSSVLEKDRNLIDILENYPVDLVSFMMEGFEKTKHEKIIIGRERRKVGDHVQRRILSKIYLPKSFFWADSLIPVSKIKLHPFFLFSGVIAGVTTLVPSYTRTELYFYGANLKDFAAGLSEILTIVKKKVKVSFLDGVEIIQGDEIKGSKFNLNVFISSDDMLSLDSLGSVLVGFKPSNIPLFTSLSLRHLGIYKLTQMNLKGDYFEELIKHPEPPSLRKFSLFRKTKFFINRDKCTDCEECLNVCALSAIDLKNYTIDNKKCSACFECFLRCPEGAIEFKN